MNKEYIDRGKLIDDILRFLLVVPSEDFLLPPEKDIVKIIKSEPAVNLKGVVRASVSDAGKDEFYGKWARCGNCGSDYTIYGHKYCTDCGAELVYEKGREE